MATIAAFQDLRVWQKAMELAEGCYRASRRIGRGERWALGHQLRKSAISIPSNIAEGFGRHHTAQYTLHLRIANGSNNELRTQVELARRLQILSEEEAATLLKTAEEVGRMLHALVKALER